MNGLGRFSGALGLVLGLTLALAPLHRAVAADAPAGAAKPPPAVVYKDAACGCCRGYVSYLRRHGFQVKTVNLPYKQLGLYKRENGVSPALASCHTMKIGDYVVEGHVPVAAVRKLLAEHPLVRGIALPGMWAGSPGMDGRKAAPFKIYSFGWGPPRIFVTE